jgi:hypothetical protein
MYERQLENILKYKPKTDKYKVTPRNRAFSNEQYSTHFQLKVNLLTENYRSIFAILYT